MKLSISMLAAIMWAGLVAAKPVPSTTDITPTGLTRGGNPFPWPEAALVSTRSTSHTTNAWKIKRGLPLEQPRRLYNPNKKRALAAPSQGVAGSTTYTFAGCNAGGDGFHASTTVLGDIQQMVDQCAAFQAAQTSGGTTFAVWPGGSTCYAGITYPPNNPVDCSSGSAIIADYSPA